MRLDRHYISKLYVEIIVEGTDRPDPARTDKRPRLQVVAPYIKNGTVLFPRSGCEQLLGQIFNLGVESHDFATG